MKTAEGKFARVFVLQAEPGDAWPDALETFATEKGIKLARVAFGGFAADADVRAPKDGLLVPDESGRPRLRLPNGGAENNGASAGWRPGGALVMEITGIAAKAADNATFLDLSAPKPASVTQFLAAVTPPGEVPAVTAAAAPASPATAPVFSFNVEFL